MPRQTIHTLAYKMISDTQQFEKGIVLSRGETSKLNKELRGLKTPLQQAEDRAELLGKAFKAGAIDSRQLQQGLDKVEKELKQTTSAGGKLASFFRDRFRLDASAMLTIVGRVTSGIRSLGRAMKDTFGRLDELAKTSRVLGIDPGDLERLRTAAARLDGAAPESVAKALERMQKSIVDANDGLSTQVRAFERIGIAVSDLEGKRPLEQLLLISEALSGIKDNNAFIASVKDIFGRGGTDIGNLLRGGRDSFNASIRRLEERGVFEFGSLEQLESTIDTLADSHRVWTKMLDTLAERMAPTLERIADFIIGPSESATPVERDKRLNPLGSPFARGLGTGNFFLDDLWSGNRFQGVRPGDIDTDRNAAIARQQEARRVRELQEAILRENQRQTQLMSGSQGLPAGGLP